MRKVWFAPLIMWSHFNKAIPENCWKWKSSHAIGYWGGWLFPMERGFPERFLIHMHFSSIAALLSVSSELDAVTEPLLQFSRRLSVLGVQGLLVSRGVNPALRFPLLLLLALCCSGKERHGAGLGVSRVRPGVTTNGFAKATDRIHKAEFLLGEISSQEGNLAITSGLQYEKQRYQLLSCLVGSLSKGQRSFSPFLTMDSFLFYHYKYYIQW